MMETPQVSVICLCYNHARFVRAAIESVLAQTHRAVQLIVVDDASTDGSQQIIRGVLTDHPGVRFLSFDWNIGNCRAFNKAMLLATGEFIIDLAADDVLYPTRIEEGLKAFALRDKTYGVNFTDAELINESGGRIGYHSNRFPHGGVPQGNIYAELIGRFFINSPTMMTRRAVFDSLGGYDESLAYEDFDFWVRSSRSYLYCYTPQALIQRRILDTSMSRQQYKRSSPQLITTYLVCRKVSMLNKTLTENKALLKRIRYEMRKSFAVGEIRLVWKYFKLYWSVVFQPPTGQL